MLTEFDDHARELRRAKDQDELDRFMAHRNMVLRAGWSSEAACRTLKAFSHYETYKHSR